MTNSVCNAVSHAVVNKVRTHVQNQNQNQTVLTGTCSACVAETKSKETVTYALLDLEPIA